MLDYHLHLWPHERADTWLSVDQVAAYCDAAAAHGVTQLALTEHLHRFREITDLLGPFWEHEDDPPAVRQRMGEYFEHHARSDLDSYVELCVEAKSQGLPVVVGLEVDYYRGQMDRVADLLAQYPFDVLIGSVHWIGAWQLDWYDDTVMAAQWDVREVDRCWDDYTERLCELAATGAVDVLAHPDLVKVYGRVPDAPEEWWDRMAEAAGTAGISAEVSSAGWFKPVGEQYPALGLLERFAARGVTFTTASDAHRVERVAARSADLRELLVGAGVDSLATYAARRRVVVPIGPSP